MYLLLDVTVWGPLWGPSDTEFKYTAINVPLPLSLKHLPPILQQQLLKVIKGHLSPSCDRMNLTPPTEKVPQRLISSSLRASVQAVFARLARGRL